MTLVSGKQVVVFAKGDTGDVPPRSARRERRPSIFTKAAVVRERNKRRGGVGGQRPRAGTMTIPREGPGLEPGLGGDDSIGSWTGEGSAPKRRSGRPRANTMLTPGGAFVKNVTDAVLRRRRSASPPPAASATSASGSASGSRRTPRRSGEGRSRQSISDRRDSFGRAAVRLLPPPSRGDSISLRDIAKRRRE